MEQGIQMMENGKRIEKRIIRSVAKEEEIKLSRGDGFRDNFHQCNRSRHLSVGTRY